MTCDLGVLVSLRTVIWKGSGSINCVTWMWRWSLERVQEWQWIYELRFASLSGKKLLPTSRCDADVAMGFPLQM